MAATLVKICGTTTVADARLSQAAGADYLGVIIDHAPSPRNVPRDQAEAIFEATDLPTVAVTVNNSRDQLLELWRTLRPAALQLHGDESPALMRDLAAAGVVLWVACSGSRAAAQARAQGALAAGAAALLMDARHEAPGQAPVYGGTGLQGDWQLAAELGAGEARIILAGGLDAANVAGAIAAVGPWMVDVISGVEARKGEKDEAKLRAFISAARP